MINYVIFSFNVKFVIYVINITDIITDDIINVPINKTINDFNFMWTKVEYPLLVYKFGKFEIVAEIKITEKQYAIGTQPMLYLCFPITELENSENLVGRTAQTKEFANFVINDKTINVFLEMLKLFGTLSKNHNKDAISIINVILNS